MSSLASVKLSPALKALIAAPHALGSAVPAPPKAVSTALFDGVRQRAEAGGLGQETWLTLKTAALMTVNSPATLCDLWSYSTKDQAVEKQAAAAAIMREVGLKCISFNGIPRSINGLGALRSHLPHNVTELLDTTAHRTPDPSNIDAIGARGMALWDSIYQPHSTKLLTKLQQSHPDLPVHILHSHYSALLSDPFSTSPSGGFKVGRILTSLVAIACLRGQQGVGPQVTSHVFGLKKALVKGGGAEEEEPLAGQDWLTSDDGLSWILESVDKIMQVVGAGSTFAGPIRRGEAKL